MLAASGIQTASLAGFTCGKQNAMFQFHGSKVQTRQLCYVNGHGLRSRMASELQELSSFLCCASDSQVSIFNLDDERRYAVQRFLLHPYVTRTKKSSFMAGIATLRRVGMLYRCNFVRKMFAREAKYLRQSSWPGSRNWLPRYLLSRAFGQAFSSWPLGKNSTDSLV